MCFVSMYHHFVIVFAQLLHEPGVLPDVEVEAGARPQPSGHQTPPAVQECESAITHFHTTVGMGFFQAN